MSTETKVVRAPQLEVGKLYTMRLWLNPPKLVNVRYRGFGNIDEPIAERRNKRIKEMLPTERMHFWAEPLGDFTCEMVDLCLTVKHHGNSVRVTFTTEQEAQMDLDLQSKPVHKVKAPRHTNLSNLESMYPLTFQKEVTDQMIEDVARLIPPDDLTSKEDIKMDRKAAEMEQARLRSIQAEQQARKEHVNEAE